MWWRARFDTGEKTKFKFEYAEQGTHWKHVRGRRGVRGMGGAHKAQDTKPRSRADNETNPPKTRTPKSKSPDVHAPSAAAEVQSADRQVTPGDVTLNGDKQASGDGQTKGRDWSGDDHMDLKAATAANSDEALAKAADALPPKDDKLQRSVEAESESGVSHTRKYRGIYKVGNKKWRAQITHAGTQQRPCLT